MIAFTRTCAVIALDTEIALLAADLHREYRLATLTAVFEESSMFIRVHSATASIAAGLIMAAVLAFPAAASGAVTLKLSTQWNENTVSSEVDRWRASEIEKRTAGEVKVKIFYAGALAKPNENLQLIKSGGVELVNMSASYFGAELPLFTAVDCIPFSVDLMVNYQIFEVAKHIYDVTLWLGPTGGVWVNRSTWNALTPGQQKIVDEVSEEAAIKDRDLTVAAATTATERLKAAGVSFHHFPDADKKAWKAANPDFFAVFVEAQDKAGRGDSARSMIGIWSEVVVQR